MRRTVLAVAAVACLAPAAASADLATAIIGGVVSKVVGSLFSGGGQDEPPADDPRNIPDAALSGRMDPPYGRLVTIDGEEMRLAPGCRIFDLQNRSILPATLRDPVPVRYELDARSQVRKVWLLAAR